MALCCAKKGTIQVRGRCIGINGPQEKELPEISKDLVPSNEDDENRPYPSNEINLKENEVALSGEIEGELDSNGSLSEHFEGQQEHGDSLSKHIKENENQGSFSEHIKGQQKNEASASEYVVGEHKKKASLSEDIGEKENEASISEIIQGEQEHEGSLSEHIEGEQENGASLSEHVKGEQENEASISEDIEGEQENEGSLSEHMEEEQENNEIRTRSANINKVSNFKDQSCGTEENNNFKLDKSNMKQYEASVVSNTEGYKLDDLQNIEEKSTFQSDVNLKQNEAPVVNNDNIGHYSAHSGKLNLKGNEASLVSNNEEWKNDERLQFGRKKTDSLNVNENEASLKDSIKRNDHGNDLINIVSKDHFQPGKSNVIQSDAPLAGNINDRHIIEFKELDRKNFLQDFEKNTLTKLRLNQNDYTEEKMLGDNNMNIAGKNNFQPDKSNPSQNHASLTANIEEDKHEIKNEKLDGKSVFQSNKVNLDKSESPLPRENELEKERNNAVEEGGKGMSKLQSDNNEVSLTGSEGGVQENRDTVHVESGSSADELNWGDKKASLRACRDGGNRGNGLNLTENKEGKEKLNAKIYEVKPEQINEKAIREIIGNTKRSGIPHCSIKEYESREKWEQMALAEKKQGHLEKRRDVGGDLIFTDPTYFESLEYLNELRQSQLRHMRDVGFQLAINKEKHKRSINSMSNKKNIFPLDKVMFSNTESTNVSNKSLFKATENLINNPMMHHTGSNGTLGKNIMEEIPHIPEFNKGYKIIKFPSNIRLVENDDVPEKYIQLRSIFPLNITQNDLNETNGSPNLIEQTSEKIISESINGKEVGKSRVEYLYTQQVPVCDRIIVQNDGQTDSSSFNKDDCITIMINPKTLQNRGLSAEYMKKSEENQSPDTLILNLTPLNATEINTSEAPTIQENLSVKTNFSGDPVERDRRDVTNLEDLNIKHTDCSQYFESDTPLNGFPGYLNQPLLQASTRTQDAKIELPKDWPAKIVIIEEKAGKPHPNSPQIVNSNKAERKGTSDCSQFNTASYTTQDLKNFKELHEGYKESNDAAYNELYKLNQKWINEATKETTTTKFSMCKNCIINLALHGKERKRDIAKSKKSKSIPPIIIMYPKSEEGINMEECESLESFNGDEALIENSIATKIANKKIENKILEGFINSIISNYTKELVTTGPRKTDTENGDEIMDILKDVVNSKEVDLKNLNPLIVPQEDIAKFNDNDEYEKFGPFSEDLLKSVLSDNSLDSIDLSQHNIK